MNNILKENIILPAWETVKENAKIKKYYLIPGFLSIIFLTFLLVYQAIYTYVEVFDKKDKALVFILDLFHSEYIIEIIITGIIFLLIYFITLPIFEGGLIHYIDHKARDEEITGSEAFGMGMYKFFPIFEYNNIFSEFKFISIINAFLFTIRFIGVQHLQILLIVFSVLLLFSIILNILFAYSKYFIVLENQGVFSAVGKSAKVALLNLKVTIKLYILMFILNIRVILNFVIFLIFPIIISATVLYITSQIFLIVTLSILTILFILAIYILGYLSAVLEVFKTAIWYNAYKIGREKIKKIEDES
ncbi:MAG: hypothetical protein GY828_04945 [Candidatus Gracilibacteria bacterium]|nr:hypothetical protein [Candidatus Gracilibacteria bacterium]